MEPIGIAGAGRVAQALGRLLRERGEPVTVVASRDAGHAAAAARFVGGIEATTYAGLGARAARVLIAVPDDALEQVARRVAEGGMNGGAALHTCGARGPEALAALAARGVSCGALHPLQTIATPDQGMAALPGSSFGLSGEGAALEWAERIVSLLNGEQLRVAAECRPLYHAAAVMASNYVAGLVDAAVMLMGAAGIEEGAALRAIAPLVRAGSGNALELGPVNALTGPIERGDLETVALHLKALAGAPATVRQLYCCAGLHLVDVARRRGLCEDRAHRLEELLSQQGSSQ